MPITQLPTPPARSDPPATFIARADAFVGALPNFVTEVNAFGASLSTLATTSTSITSLAIGVGNKALTVGTGKSYQVGMTVKIASTVAPANWMLGDVTSYTSATGALGVVVSATQGAGTVAAWTVSMAASGGASLGSNTYTGAQNEAQGADIASASTIDLGAATGNLVDVTGVATITAITLAQGAERVVRFTGACTLTHGPSLVLPGGANIVAAAGDFAIFRGYAAGVVRCTEYMLASAAPDVHQAANKATPIDADESGWWDSVTQKLVKVTWANLKATIAAYMSASGNSATATTAAACSGNSATATTAAACSGNSATATTAAACSGNSATATTAAACSGNAATASSVMFTAGNVIGAISYALNVTAGMVPTVGANYTASGAIGTYWDPGYGATGTWKCISIGARYTNYNDGLFQRIA